MNAALCGNRASRGPAGRALTGLLALTLLGGAAQRSQAQGNGGGPTTAPSSDAKDPLGALLGPAHDAPIPSPAPSSQTQVTAPARRKETKHTGAKAAHPGNPPAAQSNWKAAWHTQWEREWRAKQERRAEQLRAQAALAAKQKAASSPAPAKAVPTNTGVVKSNVRSTATTASAPAPPAEKPAGIATSPAVTGSVTAKSAPAPSASSPVLNETKPDGFSAPASSERETGAANHTQDNPMATVGDSWKMLVYLIPMLLLLVGGLNLVRRFQERTGRLPRAFQAAARGAGGNARGALAPRPARPSGGLLGAILGGFHVNNAVQRGGSLRLVESMPIGGTYLHLIEVRGRLLLIGATGSSVSVLTEFQGSDEFEAGDFRALLHAAASDISGLDLAAPDLPMTAMVGTLEEEMRDASDSVNRRLRRLRTVQEAEAVIREDV